MMSSTSSSFQMGELVADKHVVYILMTEKDLENGGISDRPDDAVDIFHTYFGVAGLSLLEYLAWSESI